MNIGMLTKEKAEELKGSSTFVNFCVHPNLLPGLVDWLDTHAMDLVQGPSDEDDDGMPWFVVSPRSLRVKVAE